MIHGMGYRVIGLELLAAPTEPELSLLDQIVAFARFNEIDAFLEAPEYYPGVLELTIEANSSYLNEITPRFNDSIARIATDIDPNNGSLQSIVASVASQLNAQIVDWSGVPGMVVAQKGRELGERIGGESSFSQIGAELDIHATRIRDELTEYQKVTGPTAWRRRHELALMLRIDSLSLIASARRLRRIAVDVRHRLPGSHLNKALNRFDQEAPHLINLRNIAEHIDEYSIGHGRSDATGLEPGDVFTLELNAGRITITARQHTLNVFSVYEASRSLVECLTSATHHHMITHLMPPIADFDFVEYTETGVEIIARSDESAEHAKARSELVATIGRKITLPATRCPKCNSWL
jgi:hypothetical protein